MATENVEAHDTEKALKSMIEYDRIDTVHE